MKRLISVASVCALALALPAAGMAGGGGHSGQAAKKLAAQQCKAEKKADKAAFKATYGKHAMKTCVRGAESTVQQELKNAAKQCKAERQDPDQFAADYGEGRNAFGKCVSGKVRAVLQNEVEDFGNAAEVCHEELEADEEAFDERYGTSLSDDLESPGHDQDAFGQCVSQHDDDEDEDETEDELDEDVV